MRHLIENVAGEEGLRLLTRATACVKTFPDDVPVPEERILHTGLLLVARVSLPLALPHLLYLFDRTVALIGGMTTWAPRAAAAS